MEPHPLHAVVDSSSAYRASHPKQGWPVWREGDLVVVHPGTQLPPYCVKCMAPATHFVEKTLAWHTPAVYLTMLISPIVYAIVAMIVTKRAKVSAGLCDVHHKRRWRTLAAAWVIGLAGPAVACAWVGASSEGDTAWLAAMLFVLSLVAACVVGIVGARVLTPSFIDNRVVKARGACQAFLHECPSVHGPHH